MEVVLEELRFERDGRCVLDVPALTFANGMTTAIFGPNGSGKTTLLRLVASLDRPTRGLVRIGRQIAGPGASTRHCIAYAFQEAVFLRGTVRQNLELGLRLRGVPITEREERILAAVRECGIADLSNRPARKLSGGESQRVNLARALALRAPITLLDEPLAGLDRHTRRHLLDDLPRLLTTFATTTILVTHDREEAFHVADNLVVLVGGRVRAAGPKREVYRDPTDRETAELLGYSVALIRGRLVAFPPGSLRPGGGSGAFDVTVVRVVDAGNHLHVLGRAAGEILDVRLPEGAAIPAPGDRMSVVAESSVMLP